MKQYAVRGKLWKFLRPRCPPRWFTTDQVGEANITARTVRVLHASLLSGRRKAWADWWNRMPVRERELYTVLHEFCHAFLPEHDEACIEEMSRELTTILWEEGFRDRPRRTQAD